MRPIYSSVALCVICTLVLTACGEKTQSSAPANAGQAPEANKAVGAAPSGATSPSSAPGPSQASGAAVPGAAPPAPPVSITTVKAQKKDLPINLKATGSVVPLSNVDVRSQATSVIKQVHFREGQFVRKGELLFTLDARSDEAAMAKAKAQLAKDQAGLSDAKRQLARTQDLFEKKFISQAALDTAQTAVESQMAILATDQAAMESVKVALSNSRITAPSAGRVGTVNVFAGSAVQANITSLVTITQLDPIAISFSLPQRHLADALEALQAGGASVLATLPDGGGNLTGRLQFVDNAVDPNSGAVKVKAVFDNKEGKLWPGAFADVSLTAKTIKDAVVVPQEVVIRGARGTIVYVVQDGKAVIRPVQVVQSDGPMVAITGVKPGESVVNDGKQNLRPDTKVVERPAADGGGAGKGRPDGAKGDPAKGDPAKADPPKADPTKTDPVKLAPPAATAAPAAAAPTAVPTGK
jgi:RND family efflux transporter MFP subunit